MMLDISGLGKPNTRSSFTFSPENPAGAKGGGSKGSPKEKLQAFFRVAPGETITLVDVNGPGMIQSMWFGGELSQAFIFRAYWDHQEYPSVEAPLGAFMGVGYTASCFEKDMHFPTLNSAMILVAPYRGANSYWKMPFAKHCRITLENKSNKEMKTFYSITGYCGEIPEDSGYFHASYRHARPVADGSDYIVIDGIKGRGHFAGVSLAVGTNGANGCWVEGEPKMFIDGDTWPTINFTGTEDYFGSSYAFGYDKGIQHYQTYSGLYSGMFALMGSEAPMYTYQPRFMLYRWHIPDPIVFEHDFKMTMQHIHYSQYGICYRHDDYASVAYWYQTLPSEPLKALPPIEEIDIP